MQTLTFDPCGPVVLVGGSGVVGRVLAPLLARQERREVVVAARDSERARMVVTQVAEAGGTARHLPYELGTPLATAASVVVGLVNDPGDVLLQQVVRAGVPFVDITRWSSRMVQVVGRLTWAPPSQAVVLASGWMGGLLARVARALADGADVVRVDGAIRYALADASGVNSVDYIDRLWIPFEVPSADGRQVIEPYTDARTVRICGRPTRVYRLDTPEQWTLPLSRALASSALPAVAVRIGFDNGLVTRLLVGLVRLGVFRWLRHARFRGLRHSVLRASGAEHREGAHAAFRVDVETADGRRYTKTLAAPGQAMLTAVGTWLAIRQAWRAPAGVHLPEQDVDDALWTALACVGVELSEDKMHDY
jgi:hypothetical protein